MDFEERYSKKSLALLNFKKSQQQLSQLNQQMPKIHKYSKNQNNKTKVKKMKLPPKINNKIIK